MWLDIDTEHIMDRVRRKINRTELLALVVGLELLAYFIYNELSHDNVVIGFDYRIYLYQGYRLDGESYYYYYPYYWLPIFEALKQLSFYLSFSIWTITGLIGLIFSTRVFNGNALWIILNGITLFSLGSGRIMPLILTGLAMTWLGVYCQRPYWAGVGFLLLLTKYHYGAILALFLWLHPSLTWKQRGQMLVIPVSVVLISFGIYGFWPIEVLDNISKNPPDAGSAITLWQWIGPVCLILWLPILLLNLSYKKRFQLLIITCALALPYFQYDDLNMIYLYTNYLGISSFTVVGSLFLFDDKSYLVIVPLILYGLMVGSELRNFSRSYFG